MIKPILITLLVAATVTVTSRYLLSVESEYTSQLLNEPEQQHFAHEFKNFSLTNTNTDGHAQSYIYAPQTRFSMADQKTIMDSPEMIMNLHQESPITITANSAEILHEKHMTVLKNNVNVSISNQSNHDVRMTTEELTLDNVLQIAKTDLAASIYQGKGIMHGTGLEFNPNTKQIKFLNKVRGTYEY